MDPKPPPWRGLLVVMFALFVMLGLPEGSLGVAWPSIRDDFSQPDSGLSKLVAGYVLGYLVFTFLSGRLTDRLGRLPLAQLGVAATAVGLLGYATMGEWNLIIVAAFLLGGGAGLVDSTLNAEVAINHDERAMHLLHAFFGVGATGGPLLITALLATNVSWRFAYVLLLVIELAMFAVLWLVRRSADAGAGSVPSERPQRLGTVGNPGAVQAVLLVYFAAYVATEVSIGHWGFSILEQRYSDTTAGLVMAGYWGGLMAGRFFLGWLGERARPRLLLRGSVAVAIAAVTWFWLIDGSAELIGLPIAGAALAGVFPALVLMTPVWLGDARVDSAVGYQLAASSGGAIVAAWVIGRVADSSGLDSVPAWLAGLAGLLLTAHIATEALTYGDSDDTFVGSKPSGSAHVAG